MKKYIFDVDGTITPSRKAIDENFLEFFSEFCDNNDVYLVTGSDRDKTIEQITKELYNKCTRVYNCSGSDVYEQDKNVYTSDWELPEAAAEWLRAECRCSEFPLRTGLHIEERPGMINFSVVGRNATIGERKLYVDFDTDNKERIRIAKEFQKFFPAIQAVVGGETGIDIFPLGKDKSQILRDFPNDTDLHFYGDRMDPAGNDYPLMKAIINKNAGEGHSVTDWQDLWHKLIWTQLNRSKDR